MQIYKCLLKETFKFFWQLKDFLNSAESLADKQNSNHIGSAALAWFW